MIRRRLAVLALFAVVAAACGHSVLVQAPEVNPVANRQALQKEAQKEQKNVKGQLSKGGNTSVNVGNAGTTGGSGPSGGTSQTASSKCATNSDPGEGFTSTSLNIGTIIPLTGALRPLGEQTVNVMKVAVNATLNNSTHIPGPYAKVDWGCSSRSGVFGRHVSLEGRESSFDRPSEHPSHTPRVRMRQA